MIIIGLVVLLAATIIGVVGVVDNAGSAHALTDDFTLFGYHFTGSSGALFLYGIILGAIAAFGLSMLLGGALRNSRRARDARRELKQTRHETTVGQPDVQPDTAPIQDHRTWRHPFGGTSAGPSAAPH